MKHTTLALLGMLLLCGHQGALAEVPVAPINSANVTPAATLLLPYFEIDAIANFPDDFQHPDSVAHRTASVTFGNTSAAPVLTRVTLWTDFGIPTFSFDFYLGGYDMERLDLRELFDGITPRSGPGVTHVGAASQPNQTFPNCPSSMGQRFSPQGIVALRNAHSGQPSALFPANQCGSANHGDLHLRGYLTIDVISQCNLSLMPNAPGYAAILATGTAANVLWGSWETIDTDNNFSDAGTLVHIASADAPIPGNLTFYRRFSAGNDQREALGSVWGQRYAVVPDTWSTSINVWREPRATPVPSACNSLPPYLPPSDQRQLVAIDSAGNRTVLTPTAPTLGLVTQRIRLGGPELALPYNFGWLYLNLNNGGNDPADLSQSFVSGSHSSPGRFSAGIDAVMLAHPAGPNPNPVLPVNP